MTGGWREAARLAVGTLTAWPVAAPAAVDRRVAGRAMMLAPVVGAALGALGGGVAWGATRLGMSALLAAALALGALALATRALHLDGLADTADGLAASYQRDGALAVMRRGDVGPAGAACLVLVLLVQVAALADVLSRTGAVDVVLAGCASRLALPIACLRGIPAARAQGLGATVAGSVPRVAGLLVTALTVLLLIALARGSGHWWRGALGGLAAVLVTGLIVRRCVSRLGGVTGDVLGACVEACLAAALVTLSVTR